MRLAEMDLRRFFGSVIGQDAVRRFTQREDTPASPDRVALAAEAARLDHALAALHEAHACELAPLADTLARAQEALRTATEAHDAVARRQRVDMYELSNRRDRARHLLYCEAPPRIDVFKLELRELVAAARTHVEERSAPSVRGGRLTWSNAASVQRYVAAIFAAIAAADALKYDVLTEDEIEARLHALRHGLPTIDRAAAEYPGSGDGHR